jgi:uncharacterized cupredoxin-like copper-binding protein
VIRDAVRDPSPTLRMTSTRCVITVIDGEITLRPVTISNQEASLLATYAQLAGRVRYFSTMKTLLSTIIAAVVSLNVVCAEGPVEKAGEVAEDAANTAKNVGRSVAKGTKKAVNTVADALTPDSDAYRVDVKLNDYSIDMPTSLKRGKTAFVVKNTGKQKHNFEVQGNGTDQKFLVNLGRNETKVLHVNLKRGTYTVYCPVNGHRKKGMDVKLTVR